MRRIASIVIASAVAAILANAASATPTAPVQPAATPSSSLSNVNLFGSSPSVRVAPKLAAAVGAQSGNSCSTGQHLDSATGKCVADKTGFADNGGLGGHGPGGLIVAGIFVAGAIIGISSSGGSNNNTAVSGR